jgi:spore coat-associated protein N
MFKYISTHPRRTIGGLATILASLGLAVGSGATFTSHTANPSNTFSSGSLIHTNDKNGFAIVTGANLKPGDVSTGLVKIKNTGTLKGNFKLSETNDTNNFAAGNLKLKIEDVTNATTIYSGDLGSVAAAGIALTGDWAVNEERTYKFTVTLDPNTPNSDQGKTATADYEWDEVQAA